MMFTCKALVLASQAPALSFMSVYPFSDKWQSVQTVVLTRRSHVLTASANLSAEHCFVLWQLKAVLAVKDRVYRVGGDAAAVVPPRYLDVPAISPAKGQ
jgi:hypothetical protein